jgi:hypothetical protein
MGYHKREIKARSGVGGFRNVGKKMGLGFLTIREGYQEVAVCDMSEGIYAENLGWAH